MTTTETLPRPAEDRRREVHDAGDFGCDSCGACAGCSGCADDQNPVDHARGDCEECGACGPCIKECLDLREQDAEQHQSDAGPAF